MTTQNSCDIIKLFQERRKEGIENEEADCAGNHDYAEIYPLIAVVVELDTENDLILFEDDAHEIWAMEGIEDWFVDDIAILLMDDMETEDFHDDEILRAFYVGYVSET